MANLTPLDSWLKVGTWDTHHSCDQERFYKAVYKLILVNDSMIEPHHIRNYIVTFKEGVTTQEHLEEIADIYSEKYDVIYSFLYENKIKLK